MSQKYNENLDRSMSFTSDLPDEELPPSKSQLKREADAIRNLGVELAALSVGERARIDLPEDVRDAVDLLNRTKQRSARKRQIGFLAKKLRKIDVAPIETALEQKRQDARSQSRQHHLVERWRDRLIGLDEALPAPDALTELLERYPGADRQQIRQLQRRALEEQVSGKPPRATRQLFQTLRALILEAPDAES